MPVTFDPEVEALIGTLSADQQGQFREKIGKGYLRQDDYSRKMTEAQRLKDSAESLHAKNIEWWQTSGEEKWRETEARNLELKNEADELRRRVAAAAAGNNGEAAINSTELDARVKAEIDRRGYLSKADTEKLVKEIATQTRKEAEEAAAASAGANMAWAARMSTAQNRYEREFGELLDEAAFSKFMTENGLAGDPYKAMEQYTAPRRQQKEIDQKVEAARAEERDKVTKELAGRSMPGNAGVGAGESSPAVRLIRREDTGGFVLPKGEKLGNGAAAAAAAARLVAAGKY